jgi:hypothetical protein
MPQPVVYLGRGHEVGWWAQRCGATGRGVIRQFAKTLRFGFFGFTVRLTETGAEHRTAEM